MLNFYIQLRNPWHKGRFKPVWVRDGLITKHKAWESQISVYAYDLFCFVLDLNWRGKDHAGPEIALSIFGVNLAFKVYDIRHWDEETSTWKNHE